MSEAINPLVEAIAEQLGLKLGRTQYSHGGTIVTDFGAEMFVRTPSYGKMGEVTPVWPCDSKRQQHRPSGDFDIGFSLTKDVRKIAQDITGRFLPEFKDAWLGQIKIAREWSDGYEAKEKATIELCEAAGFSTRADYGSQDITGYCNNRYMKLRVGGSNTIVSIDCVDKDEALKIIALIHTFPEKKDE